MTFECEGFFIGFRTWTLKDMMKKILYVLLIKMKDITI